MAPAVQYRRRHNMWYMAYSKDDVIIFGTCQTRRRLYFNLLCVFITIVIAIKHSTETSRVCRNVRDVKIMNVEKRQDIATAQRDGNTLASCCLHS